MNGAKKRLPAGFGAAFLLFSFSKNYQIESR